ncbi:hypothetical protein SLA2020_275030 [Shorea laevis]
MGLTTQSSSDDRRLMAALGPSSRIIHECPRISTSVNQQSPNTARQGLGLCSILHNCQKVIAHRLSIANKCQQVGPSVINSSFLEPPMSWKVQSR